MSSTLRDDGVGERLRRSAVRIYLGLTRPSRRPLSRQLAIGLGAYALIFAALVVLRINGSAMGLLYPQFYDGTDPRLIVGRPWPIRSDEWLVATPLMVSQVELGLPRFNGVLPGGFDASIVWDMPTRDWSVLLRPHMWGFLALPLDYAFAFRWWLPFFVTAAAAFVLACLLWRRPLASWVIAGAFVISPFFQWWFGSGSFWPPAAALAACAATVVLLRDQRTWVHWTVAAIVGYLVAVATIALYPPFLISCVYPALAFCVGWFATRSSSGLPWRRRWQRLMPMGVAAVAAAAVVAGFLLSHSEAVEAVNSTVYPGQRLVSPGTPTTISSAAVYAGVFGSALHGDIRGFAPNASEGSSFLFLGFYLLPSAGWLVWSRWRRLREVDWALLAVVASLGLLVAFRYVPGWDALAHLLLLDRVTVPRVLIGFGVVSMILLVLIVGRLRETGTGRVPWWTTLAAVALVLGNHFAVWWHVRVAAPAVLTTAIWWLPMLVLLVLAIAMFSRGWVTPSAVLAGIVALVVAGWVNPIYQGVLDLRSTDVAQAVEGVDAGDPGAWVALGSIGATAVLRQTGVEAYSGVQAWPTDEMWEELDPDGSDEAIWNRYAHVNWTADLAADALVLVQADVVQVRLDSCDAFAQEHLDHVLSQGPVTGQRCLEQVDEVQQGPVSYVIYDVVPSDGS
jgi:hypothetical protein